MTKKLLVDIAERTVWTAIQAFLAVWLVTAKLDAVTFKAAGVAALVAAAKCVLATRIGDSDSAAAIPGVEGDG